MGRLNNSKRWSTFFLIKNGERIEEHLARCPGRRLSSRRRRSAKFAACPDRFLLRPRAEDAHPGSHRVTNTRFIVHMALAVPPSCGFRVGAETREWREGSAWVFDDTFEHEAWNDSGEPRIVLIFDVWNSFLTSAERISSTW